VISRQIAGFFIFRSDVCAASPVRRSSVATLRIMSKRPVTLLLLTAIAVGVVLTTACSTAGSATPGPLVMGDKSTVCTSSVKHARVLFATHLELETGESITIHSVEPVEADNLEVRSNSVMFLTGDVEMLIEDVPPAEDFASDWADRVAAAGATFTASDHVQLVSEVQSTPGKRASLEALRIAYSAADGGWHEVTTNMSLVLAAAEC
jgi:hypothetical protein